MDLEKLKEDAALEALARVRSGMRLGLGTGSTVAWFLKHLGRRIEAGELTDIAGVPTSDRTEKSCAELGISVISLSSQPRLDLAVDGADEVSPELDLIKGMGGALLREKMVAAAADHLVIIADETKLVQVLGERSPLPVEVVTFEWESHLGFLRQSGCEPALRMDPGGHAYVTDNGNYILDCRFAAPIQDVHALARRLADRPGVVDHGLFLGMARTAVIAAQSGVAVRERSRI